MIRHRVPQDAAVTLLDLYLREMKTYTKTHAGAFIAALFITVKKWKQSSDLSGEKYISKLSYIHTLEYYAVIKKSGALTHATA